MIDPPDASVLADINDVTPADFPRFALAHHDRDHPQVENIPRRTARVLDQLPKLDQLPPGSGVGVTAGSRGIHDMPTVIEATVSKLKDMGLEPFILPAMGSHGGASAEGQVEMLESLGITEAAMGAEIRSNMAVEQIGTDSDHRPVFVSTDALNADAILVANRVKAHTDFHGEIESGLCKITVIGLGKQRGAEAAHNAALASSFREVLPERAAMIFDEAPIVGGLAVIENAQERAAQIEALDVDEIIDAEPELLATSKDLLPTLPVDDLDLLVIDEVGKNISGTGMDTNVIGRFLMHGEPEPDDVDYTRIYARSVTDHSHGNAIGIGLADFAHQHIAETINLTDTYVNGITGGEPARARLPVITPSDALAFQLAYSTTGVRDPSDMRIMRIPNTLELEAYQVSEAVARELSDHPDITVSDPEPIRFEDGELPGEPYAPTPMG